MHIRIKQELSLSVLVFGIHSSSIGKYVYNYAILHQYSKHGEKNWNYTQFEYNRDEGERSGEKDKQMMRSEILTKF